MESKIDQNTKKEKKKKVLLFIMNNTFCSSNFP